MVAIEKPSIRFCMPNTTKCILLVSRLCAYRTVAESWKCWARDGSPSIHRLVIVTDNNVQMSQQTNTHGTDNARSPGGKLLLTGQTDCQQLVLHNIHSPAVMAQLFVNWHCTRTQCAPIVSIRQNSLQHTFGTLCSALSPDMLHTHGAIAATPHGGTWI
jgi:hypothetical protein